MQFLLQTFSLWIDLFLNGPAAASHIAFRTSRGHRPFLLNDVLFIFDFTEEAETRAAARVRVRRSVVRARTGDTRVRTRRVVRTAQHTAQ